MNETPFQPTADTDDASQPTAADSYNIVADTVTGVNVRWSDNKFQAIFVSASIVLALPLGAVLALLNPRWNLPWYGGVLIAAFLGLVLGVLASGIYLMIYRATRHIQGKHD